jgi:transcription elongation GreA/GreB family factor
LAKKEKRLSVNLIDSTNVDRTGFPITDIEKLSWKHALKEACIEIIHERILHIEQAMLEARESANSEEKSSAGDKYETSRAMGHLAQEMQSKQLEDAKQELDLVNRLNATVVYTSVSTGAVIISSDFIFYISLGLGNTEMNGHKITLLSPKAPIATLLYQKKKGESFVFNGKTIEILDVF